jgi:hypothetical protein
LSRRTKLSCGADAFFQPLLSRLRLQQKKTLRGLPVDLPGKYLNQAKNNSADAQRRGFDRTDFI